MFPLDPKLEEAQKLLAIYMQSNKPEEWQKAERDLLEHLFKLINESPMPTEAVRLVVNLLYNACMMEGVEAHSQALMGKLIDKMTPS